MSPLRRTLTGGVLSLLATIALVQSSGAADQVAANGALLTQYFADINAHDVSSR